MALSLTPEVLHIKTTPVTLLADYAPLKDEMIALMQSISGVGLAAPQVGISKSFFVMETVDGPIMCFNPKILQKSASTEDDLEGCLSHPGELRNKTRHYDIRVLYYDETGKHIVRNFTGIYARIFQHEMDHLSGRTILSN